VGYKYSGLLSNNAALGQSVTVTGGASSRTAARVYAYPASGGGTNNHALNTMRLERSAIYNDQNPFLLDTTPPAMTGAAAWDSSGADMIPPTLAGSLDWTAASTETAAVITGIFIWDTGGSGLTSTVVIDTTGTAIGTPVYASGKITGLDPSSLTSGSTVLTLTVADNSDNSARYDITVTHNGGSAGDLTDYDVTGPVFKDYIVTINGIAINGFYVSDSGGLAAANPVEMDIVNDPDGENIGSPVYNTTTGKITGINVSGLSDADNYVQFNFTLTDAAGNEAVYRIEVRRTTVGAGGLPDYTLSGPAFVSSTPIAGFGPTTANGADAAASGFKNESFWGTVLGFGPDEWNFGGVVGRGYPHLLWE
jgi:hypothetical protein